MTEFLAKLSAPFPPDRVSWRVGSTTGDKKRGMALAYIDARDVMGRLDEVCGPYWQCRYPHANGKTICEIGIKVGDEWVWRADGAGDTDFEAEKGAISDAFKRAAVKWGIGKYLYDVDAPWVEIEPAGKSFKIAQGEYAKLRAVLTKGAPPAAAPAPQAPAKRAEQPPAQSAAKTTHGYHMVNPHDPKDVRKFDKASDFIAELEHEMAQGNAADWWATNGSVAKSIGTTFPRAVPRVKALEAMASGGLLAAG
jgi:hypothetical protein